MEIFNLLETIEDMLENSKTLPFTNKAVLDKEELLDIIKEIEKEFNVKEGHTSKDGKITLDTKNCFKKCGFAPNVQINGKLYSNCSKQNIVKLLKDMIY